jgi:ABC-type transport system involved in cytochrome c biogenesis permease subunit
MPDYKRLFHQFGSPPWFYRFSGRVLPWLWAGFALLAGWGLCWGLFVAPPDYQQGESVRIMYIHVPAAWMSMLIYGLMALFGIIALVWHLRIAELLMICSAPVGAAFTVVTLVAGSLWGRPTWGRNSHSVLRNVERSVGRACSSAKVMPNAANASHGAAELQNPNGLGVPFKVGCFR